MIRIAAASIVTFLAATQAIAPVTAQTPLEQLQARFRKEVQALDANSSSREQRDQLLVRHIGELRTFVTDKASGDDRWNGRLMLADFELVRGEREAAGEALGGIDAQQAPALLLTSAAAMAQHLQLKELRDRFVKAATDKPAPLGERLAMARLLMTVLREVELGEGVFTKALAAARDDEEKAFVRWHRADALRDREDLPENSGFEALEQLAKDLPKTYWGSVAKDRLRATRLQVGDDAIPFSAKTLHGRPLSLQALRGKAVVLAFWSAADYDTEKLVAVLEDLQNKHPDLVPIAISLDHDKAEIQKAVKRFGIDFDVVGDGKGPEGDIALRWFVEGPVVHVIDKQGKVAGLGLQAGTNFGRAELVDVIARAAK